MVTVPNIATQQPTRESRRAGLVWTGLSIVALTLIVAPFAEPADAGRGADPRPILRESTLLVSAPVGNRFYGHFWHAPSTAGGACSFVTVDRLPQPRPSPIWRGGGECGTAPRPARVFPTARTPFVVGLSIGRKPTRGNPARWVPPIVYGSILRRLHARRLQIEWQGGTHRLSYRAGYFLGGMTKLYMPPFAAFPFVVVAYDGNGREVARRKLESPALRMMGGWTQY